METTWGSLHSAGTLRVLSSTIRSPCNQLSQLRDWFDTIVLCGATSRAAHCTALVSAGSWRCASSARSSRCSWCATTIRRLRGTSSPSSTAVLCGRHSLRAVPHCSTYAEYPCSIAGTPPLFVYAATLTCVRRLCSTTVLWRSIDCCRQAELNALLR